jgi:hypothetical protein
LILVGDVVRLWVRVADGDTQSARVVNLVPAMRTPEIEGGLLLDRPLNGFRYWNMRDVKRVPHGRR